MSNIRRGQRNRDFTTIENVAIEDSNLSPQSLGVLVYILSKHPTWKAHKSEILNRFSSPHSLKKSVKISTTKNMIDSVFSELIAAGYVVVEPIFKRLENGKMSIVGSEYVFYDMPMIKEEKNEVTDTPTSQRVEDVQTSEDCRGSKKLGSIIKTESNIDKSILEDNKTNTTDFLQKSNIEILPVFSENDYLQVNSEKQAPSPKAKKQTAKQLKAQKAIEAAKEFQCPENLDIELFAAIQEFYISRFEKNIPISTFENLVKKTIGAAQMFVKEALLEHLEEGIGREWQSPFYVNSTSHWQEVVQKRQDAIRQRQATTEKQVENELPFEDSALETSYQKTVTAIRTKVVDFDQTSIIMLSRGEFFELFIGGDIAKSMLKITTKDKIWKLFNEVLDRIALNQFGIKKNRCRLFTHVATVFKEFKSKHNQQQQG